MMDLVFEVIQEEDGGFSAQCLSEDIFTQAGSWHELRSNVKEAVACHLGESASMPGRIRLHLVRDEVLAI